MKSPLRFVALALLLAPFAARAQVGIHIDIGLPASPPLVVVQPGVQVVEGFREEVFVSGGWYWCRRDDGWYRARSPQSQFLWVEPRRVPVALVRVPRGQYRNWHRAEHAEFREHKRAVHEEQRERREERHEEHRDQHDRH
jgi:hypothetical protein